MRTLAMCRNGEPCQITQINGSDEVSQRLMEMGLVPGTTVKLVGRAPLGDPVEVEVRGYRLSLRKEEAARVQISTQ